MTLKPIKGYGAFAEVFDRGKRFASGPVGITVIGSESSAGDEIAVGVSVGKRTAPHAVVRSRIRRHLRNAIRIAVDRNEAEFVNAGLSSMVIVWRARVARPSLIDHRDVESSVETALLKAVRAFSTKNGSNA